ncbi:hypothetical protein B9Z55_006519 [Caenorhabditis nigoni]|uniref:Uncharacterized protein n=1 Tax=Caenorhabditis nigoni TaxID=1611254 RepID=A0A2G5V688_9PELO|nr:hypothetical protein B9Z55_010007 [Caenorhabditis nigoni]PIC47036.1 hypothetical protein B9Z55_006519 [Caenorhabditis nigoni]
MTGEFRFHENPDTSSRRALSHLDEGRPEDHDEVPFTSVDGSKRRAEGCLSQVTNLDKRKLCAIGQQHEQGEFWPRNMRQATSSGQCTARRSLLILKF